MLCPMSIARPTPGPSSNEVPASGATSLPEYDSPSSLARLLETEGLSMSKRFGQNFLVNRGAREKVLAVLGPRAGERAWEIGPGIGSMTVMLLGAGLELSAFEIDHGFARLLRRFFADQPRFRLVEGDFLRTWKGESAGGGPDLIFGNLPYNVAAAIIAALIEGGQTPRRMVFTVQREAALRMTARPATKDYSSFTVLCASAWTPRLAFDLGAGSFWPQPRVTSSVVVMEPAENPLSPDDRRGFSRFVRQSFASRRKTLRNNLKAAGWGEGILDEALASEGLDDKIRAEALSPQRLHSLYSRACASGPHAPTIDAP